MKRRRRPGVTLIEGRARRGPDKPDGLWRKFDMDSHVGEPSSASSADRATIHLPPDNGRSSRPTKLWRVRHRAAVRDTRASRQASPFAAAAQRPRHSADPLVLPARRLCGNKKEQETISVPLVGCLVASASRAERNCIPGPQAVRNLTTEPPHKSTNFICIALTLRLSESTHRPLPSPTC